MRPAGTTAVVTGSFPAVAIAVAIVSGAAGMVGVYLDTAWHRTVGRDSFFILPHVFIYCGRVRVLGACPTNRARTPDLSPFLVALLVPVVLVAAARAVGPWAPTLACLLFLGVTWLMDVMLRAIEFDRYTLTPILALPAAVLSLAFWGEERQPARSRRDGAWLSVAAGGAVTLGLLTIEVRWIGL